MPISVYQRGTPVTISQTFTSGGLPVTPASVTLTVRLPDGTVASYSDSDPQMTQDSPFTGTYAVDYPTTLTGRYFYRWEATDQAASEGEFVVTTTRFPTAASTVPTAVEAIIDTGHGVPAGAPDAGVYMYIDEDTGIAYLWIGGAWVQIVYA